MCHILRFIFLLQCIFCPLSCSYIKNKSDAVKSSNIDQKFTFVFDFDYTLHKYRSYPRAIVYSSYNHKVNEKLLKHMKKLYLESEEKSIKKFGSAVGVFRVYDVFLGLKINKKIKQKDIDFVINEVKKEIDPEMGNIIKKLKSDGHQVIIIGGGALGCAIIPDIVKDLGISKSDIYSGYWKDFSKNSLKKSFLSKDTLDHYEYVNCADPDTHTAYSYKKSDIINLLKSKNIIHQSVIHIGDGHNDLETWQAKAVDLFIGFGVFDIKKDVQKGAPIFVTSIPQFKDVLSERCNINFDK